MGFSRQEYWSGLPFPSPGDLPNPGIEPRSPTLQADALTSASPTIIKWYVQHTVTVSGKEFIFTDSMKRLRRKPGRVVRMHWIWSISFRWGHPSSRAALAVLPLPPAWTRRPPVWVNFATLLKPLPPSPGHAEFSLCSEDCVH